MAQMTRRCTPNALALALGLLLSAGVAPAGAQSTPTAQQAREAAWAGRVGEGLRLMDEYLAANPDDREARLDRARFLAWRGDYAAAIEALDALGPDTDAARALRARIHAWAGHRETALATNAPLYAADPADYENAFTQAMAARIGEWPHEALPALAAVQAAKPDTRDTRDLVRSVRLPLFSSIGVPASLYSDSDDIEIRSVGLEARLRLADQWMLLADVADREHSARAGFFYAPVTGGDSVDERRVTAGVRYAVAPEAALEVVAGRSDLDPGAGETIGHLEWSQRAHDGFRYRLRAERDRVTASPRSVSLGIMREGVRGWGEWRPSLRDTVRGQLAFDRLTDGNHRTAVDADYRRAVVRTERVNVDVGAQAEWQSYSDQLQNGYYAPEDYVRVAPLVSTYVKFSDDVGLFLQGAVGVQRAAEFGSWKRASDVSAELTFGAFSPWQFVLSAGYSERLNEFGQYEGTNVGLALRYRFCEFRADRCPRPSR